VPEHTPEHATPAGYGTVTPWIISKDSAGLIRFLEAAFSAEEIVGSRMLNADGSIGHVEVTIGSSIVMLFDTYPGWPETPSFLRLFLEDADTTYRLGHRSDRALLGRPRRARARPVRQHLVAAEPCRRCAV
jgi:hypothetical protein